MKGHTFFRDVRRTEAILFLDECASESGAGPRTLRGPLLARRGLPYRFAPTG